MIFVKQMNVLKKISNKELIKIPQEQHKEGIMTMKLTKKHNELIRLKFLKGTVCDTLPGQDDYLGSIYFSWINIIKQGEKKELDVLNSLAKSINNSANNSTLLDDLGEDYYRIKGLSKEMYATVIVSIWSKVEYYHGLIASCLGIGKNVYKINDFSKKMEKIGINITLFNKYNEINAVRILNNRIKHENGLYKNGANKVNNKKEDVIEPAVFNNWQAAFEPKDTVGKTYKIDCSKLNIEQILSDCNNYLKDLFDKAISYRENKN
mgnify:CR=1 FL=1